ncbi:MAG: hypothetical protein AAF903_00895, partial [Pseudomonadota bacterium]
MTRIFNSPVDDVAKEALNEWKQLDNDEKREFLEQLIKSRDSSKVVSEGIFLLLATLLLPIIMWAFFGKTDNFSFLGVSFELNMKSIFFLFFIGNLFYIYKISHFAKVVSSEKVIFQICQ